MCIMFTSCLWLTRYTLVVASVAKLLSANDLHHGGKWQAKCERNRYEEDP